MTLGIFLLCALPILPAIYIIKCLEVILGKNFWTPLFTIAVFLFCVNLWDELYPSHAILSAKVIYFICCIVLISMSILFMVSIYIRRKCNQCALYLSILCLAVCCAIPSLIAVRVCGYVCILLAAIRAICNALT